MALYAFDGTWNEGKDGDDPKFENTNVFRFKNAYARASGTEPCYVAGIGTRFDRVGRVLGGAFGLGELPRLLETYDALCRTWIGGDQNIDLVGFSRGAATVLDFCNLVQAKGIRKPGTDQVVEPSPKLRFVGLWDVVAAFGLANLGNEALNIGHHLWLPKKSVDFCFHAMALDERRPSFINTRVPGAREVWFRGAHSDVGGGNGNQPLNDVGLRWMMRKAIAAGLPIDPADVPNPDITHLEPKHSNKLPVKIRLIRAVDRSHYTVTRMEEWTNPPDTSPTETEADERTANPVGDSGIALGDMETRRRVLVMWETALDIVAGTDFTLDPIREPLLTLFEARSPLVTDDEKLQAARKAVARLITTTIAGARQRGFHVLDEFFLNEALFKMPRVFPLTD